MSDNEFKKILKDVSFIKKLEKITKQCPILKLHVEKLQNKPNNSNNQKKNNLSKKRGVFY